MTTKISIQNATVFSESASLFDRHNNVGRCEVVSHHRFRMAVTAIEWNTTCSQGIYGEFGNRPNVSAQSNKQST